MPAAAVGAGISAVGTVAGGVASGKGAAKAAKIQAQSAANQLAFQKQMYGDDVSRYTPTINEGDAAATNYSALLGLGGDPTAANAAYDTFKNSTGYQTTLNAALAGTNASAYAAGLGRSGAALQALQDTAGNVANNTLGTYMGDLNTVSQTGENAKNALTGASTSATAQNASTTSNAANAASSAALATGASTSNALQQLGQLGSYAYNSSYPTSNTVLPTYTSSPYTVSVMSGYNGGLG